MANSVALAFAFGDFTLTSVPLNTETVTIGGKVYTYQTTLTDVDGNVLIGASAEASLDNLIAAVNLDAGAGSLYAASMTRSEHAHAVKQSATVMRAFAQVKGVIGNLIDTTETIVTGGAWGGATMASGSGSILAWLESLIALNQLNAEVISEVLSLTPAED
jgi:hypothetical protein